MQCFYFIQVGTEMQKKMANCSRLLETNIKRLYSDIINSHISLK